MASISILAATISGISESVSRPAITTPIAGVTCLRVGRIAIIQLINITLSGGVGRTLGNLPFKPMAVVVGCLNVGSSSGYVKFDTKGNLFCFSASSGNFSGQVVATIAW